MKIILFFLLLCSCVTSKSTPVYQGHICDNPENKIYYDQDLDFCWMVMYGGQAMAIPCSIAHQCFVVKSLQDLEMGIHGK